MTKLQLLNSACVAKMVEDIAGIQPGANFDSPLFYSIHLNQPMDPAKSTVEVCLWRNKKPFKRFVVDQEGTTFVFSAESSSVEDQIEPHNLQERVTSILIGL